MDYLDTKKEFRHRIVLFVGYILIAVAIVIAALVLLYQAYGFGVTRQGDVIQKGLTFFSSQPNPADIYVDGKLQSVRTNTRLPLPAGIYDVKLTRQGYHDWQRTIELNGGSIEHFDYPLLFPRTLTPERVSLYGTAPTLVTQSPDKRWVVVQHEAQFNQFTVYDLRDIEKAPITIAVPDNLLANKTTAERWRLVEWADDNEHIVLQHLYDDASEYILVNRADPTQSVNLTTTLPLQGGELTLQNRKYDKYFVFNTAAATVQRATLSKPELVPYLEDVLAFQAYGNDIALYIEAGDTPTDKVQVRFRDGDTTRTIRTLPAGSNYLVDLTKYDGAMYVVAGTGSAGRIYVYRDPIGQLNDEPDHAPIPSHVLKVDGANFVSFSSNAQFVVAQNSQQFAVYDIENREGYNYTAAQPIDAPQLHASWMDGNRLTYISNGKLVVFDYDYRNAHTLMAASSSYAPAYDPEYESIYTIAPVANSAQFELLQTPLLTPEDR